MDYPRFGLSEGLHSYILSFDKLVDDIIEHYSKIKENPEFCNKLPIWGIHGHHKQPNAWNDNMVPPRLVTEILIDIAKFLPTQKLHSLNTGFRRVGSQRCKEERTYCL